MSKACLWVLAVALRQEDAPPASESQELPRFSLEADAWVASASGWMYITLGSRPGTATRAREGNAFDLEPQVLPMVKAWFRFWDSNALGFRMVSTSESGTQSAEHDFVYHGNVYAAGRSVQAKLGLHLMDVDYQYAWKAAEEVTVTPHLGVAYWKFSSHLRTADGLPPIDEKRSFSSGYWLAGVDLDAKLSGAFRLHGSLLGGFNGTDRYFIEAEIGAGLRPLDTLELTLGYRFHELKFHTSTNEANLIFHGPYVGLAIHF